MAHKEAILQNSDTIGIARQKKLWSYSRTSSELQKKKRTRDEQETNNDEDKWPSGSKWKETHLGALHILVGPVEQKYVIPEKFLPSEDEMNKLSELWSISEEAIRNEKF